MTLIYIDSLIVLARPWSSLPIMLKFSGVVLSCLGAVHMDGRGFLQVLLVSFSKGPVGKYNLHHIWDRVLFNIPDLKINNDNGHVHRTSLSGHTQSIPTNRYLHRTIGHTGHALNLEHAHRTSYNQ